MGPTLYLSALLLALGPLATSPAQRPASTATASRPAQDSFAQLVKQAEDARTSEKFADAIRLYRSAVSSRPTWPEGWWHLGTSLYDQDRFDEAQSALDRFTKVSKDPAPAYALLALCEYETRNYDAALKHFQKWAAKGSPGNDEIRRVANYHLALLLTREGQFADALYLLTSSAQKQGANPALAEAMGLASLRMKNLPEDYAPEARERVWLAGQAVLYSSVSETARSGEFADKLLLHYNAEPNVHFLRGTLISLDKQRASDAAQEFEQELRISPQHVAAMMAVAQLYAGPLERPEDAVSFAKRATEVDPKNPLAYDALGRALLAGGKIQESAAALSQAKALAPDLAIVRLHLSEVYKKLGRNTEAAQELAAFESLSRANAPSRNDSKAAVRPAQKGGRK